MIEFYRIMVNYKKFVLSISQLADVLQINNAAFEMKEKVIFNKSYLIISKCNRLIIKLNLNYDNREDCIVCYFDYIICEFKNDLKDKLFNLIINKRYNNLLNKKHWEQYEKIEGNVIYMVINLFDIINDIFKQINGIDNYFIIREQK